MPFKTYDLVKEILAIQINPIWYETPFKPYDLVKRDLSPPN